MAVLLGWMVNMVMADRGRAGVDGQSGPGAMLDHQLTGPFGGWMFGDPSGFKRQADHASRVLRT